ncbi:acetyl-CoA synthetase [Brevibacterium siliguriense]|uniref:Acetyl-CoA synthetase n=1 Tax=Brevibacterium siliguriense TaxID=1136497 RepID=A0A1H1QEA6_9MICO|nr:acetate--CoA ligase family protein [Brevibacterium siliguriense]SDS21802.1 acetyl-CoA synthetase [Brevibacterium siliguriense]
MFDHRRLRRCLKPASIAVIGGTTAAKAIEQTRGIGFDGPVWAVNPGRNTLAGVPCYPSISDLPATPDAALVAVPAEASPAVVRELAAAGVGGAICHASGFAEDNAAGAELQDELVAAAGDMPLIGPNCIGIIDYLDGAALWPDENGGRRVESGVAVITQSGNIAQNISMQRRGMPLAFLATLGNSAAMSGADLASGLLDDSRITAIGLHLEALGDVYALEALAAKAREANVPIVALKSGTSALGEQANLSHTNSFGSPEVLVDALFTRLGIGRAHDLPTFVETLSLLHVHGALRAPTVTSASCSGGEAALLADAAEAAGVEMPELPAAAAAGLREALGPRIHVRNPLDYQTYIWGDVPAQQKCFSQLLTAGSQLHLLALDIPRHDRADRSIWMGTLEAFVGAHAEQPAPAGVVTSMSENLPEDVAIDLIGRGIVPLHGVREAMAAIRIAADISAARAVPPLPLAPTADRSGQTTRAGDLVLADEDSAKTTLSAHKLSVPVGHVVSTPLEAAAAAGQLGFPVVAKVIEPVMAHKSDRGGVRIGLMSEDEVIEAVDALESVGTRFLIEQMVSDGVAELVVGLRTDPTFGSILTLGVGGTLVEVVRDFATLLLPVRREDILRALRSLKLWPVLDGARGRARADVGAAVEAITAIVDWAMADGTVTELEVNPLILRRAPSSGETAVECDQMIGHELEAVEIRQGAVAVDVLLRCAAESLTRSNTPMKGLK